MMPHPVRATTSMRPNSRSVIVPSRLLKFETEQAAYLIELAAVAARTEGGDALNATVTIYEVLAVTVEANSGQTGAKVGVPTAERYRPLAVREAPFEAAEVLRKAETIRLQPGARQAVVCDVQVARTARAGRYGGAF